jgi:hypothetical protein
VKRELPPVPADFAPKQHFLGARAGVCFHAHLREKEEARNLSKLLTRRSAFIHDVSYPNPVPKAPLFPRSPAFPVKPSATEDRLPANTPSPRRTRRRLHRHGHDYGRARLHGFRPRTSKIAARA